MRNRISAAEGTRRQGPLRVTIVTLDNHLAGAVERTQARFDKSGEAISIQFHAAADWDADPASLEACKADIARADIIIATMLFLDDHIRAVLPAIEARREDCAAMLGMMSGAEIVRLTRIGGWRMDAPSRGPMALLKKLRGSKKPGASTGAGQMRMLRRLPKLLRFIPGTAQDVRAYFLTLQYWLAGSDDNVANMIRALAERYAGHDVKAAAPAEYPETGVYHPAIATRMSADVRALPSIRNPKGTVGLLLLRSYVLAHDAAHYDGVIAAMEAKGLRVIPAFASGLDSRPAVEAFFMKDGKPVVDALVSLTGFSLVGGPAYNDSKAAEEMLAALDLPYVAAHPLEFQTLQHWGASSQGLLPLEATMMVAIPELDGATAPALFGGRASAGESCTGCSRQCGFPDAALVRAMHPCPERAEALAAKIAKLIALRQTPKAERRVAITLFNFPPNSGATGTAAFLAVWESLYATLKQMAASGYRVALPDSVDALREAVLNGNAARHGADANVHARISADDIVAQDPWLAEIEAEWGPAPGRQQSDGRSVFVLGRQFGNVLVGIQPGFGYDGDPMRLLFEGRFAPTHAFNAYYRYLREDFAAHAVVHFGTHGALEFMPGKQAGLSAQCWPERLIGDLPNIYLYAGNNPSEGSLAKRRSGATLISYLTPALAEAGLYKGFAELKASVERWRMSEDATERAAIEEVIRDQAAAVDLEDCAVEDVAARLYELEATLVPFGLHVAGSAPSAEARAAMVAAMIAAGDVRPAAEIDALLAANGEIDALLHALDGGYIRPAPGGDVLKNADVLPTGRNMHGFDPFGLPSRWAVADGAAQAARVLDRHLESGGRFPETIAMVLWGSDNLKSEGAQIAQAMALMGARPRRDGYGRLAGAELIPLAELGRPRIDVVATLSGIFRDLLPLQTRMLAEAAYLAATAEEAEDVNFVRKHSLAFAARHGCDLETAALRVFSNAEGAYGANVNMMIEAACWQSEDELADSFETQKGFAYGRKGAAGKQTAVMTSALGEVDFAYQNLESVELGVTSIDHYVDALGGMSRSIRRAKGEAAPIYISDQTQGAGKVRTLAEQVSLETRTRMLNPAWYEDMLRHGYEGVRNIEGHVTNTFGWSATTGEVSPWVYQRITETFVLDAAMRERLATLNPKASARVANRLIEACDRDYWRPDAETLAALHAASDELEDRLEGIAPQAIAAE